MNTYRIVDLDNCISNDAWRIPYINWQVEGDRRWDVYHSLAPFDALGNRDLVTTTVHELIVLTARPVFWATATEEWLRRHGVPFKWLLMRNNDDLRHSKELKATHLEWLETLYDVPRSSIADAYDDRPDVVQMYLASGIDAHVRAIHTVDAYKPPERRAA